MIELRPQALDLIERVQNFIDEEIAHNENLYHEQSKDEDGNWVVPPIMEEMKAKAKSAGLWNLFLPESENGPIAKPTWHISTQIHQLRV